MLIPLNFTIYLSIGIYYALAAHTTNIELSICLLNASAPLSLCNFFYLSLYYHFFLQLEFNNLVTGSNNQFQNYEYEFFDQFEQVLLEFVTGGVELLKAVLHGYAGGLIFMK